MKMLRKHLVLMPSQMRKKSYDLSVFYSIAGMLFGLSSIFIVLTLLQSALVNDRKVLYLNIKIPNLRFSPSELGESDVPQGKQVVLSRSSPIIVFTDDKVLLGTFENLKYPKDGTLVKLLSYEEFNSITSKDSLIRKIKNEIIKENDVMGISFPKSTRNTWNEVLGYMRRVRELFEPISGELKLTMIDIPWQR